MSRYYMTEEDYLMHHGVKGQKWGLRQYQNEDGSLTDLGREHYGYGAKADYKNRLGIAKANYRSGIAKAAKRNSYENEAMTKAQKKKFNEEAKSLQKQYAAEKKAAKQEYKQSEEYKKERTKKAIIAGAAIVGTALAAYGAYKVINGKIQDHRAYENMLQGMQYAQNNYDFNAPVSTIARTSGLTGKTYYKLKNAYGETIQTGRTNSLEGLQSVEEARYRAAATQKANDFARLRKEYLDTISRKNK